MSAMRRLAQGQLVVLDLDEEAIDCRVAGAAAEAAVLAPVAVADAAYIPSLGRAAGLLFDGPGGRVRVTGAVTRGPEEGELSFRAGGAGRLAPRRHIARLGAELPVDLTPLDDAGEPADAPRRFVTCDLSIAGIGVRVGEWALAGGALVAFSVEVPAGAPVAGTARVLRMEEGVAGLELVHVAPADRARLATFLIAGRATG